MSRWHPCGSGEVFQAVNSPALGSYSAERFQDPNFLPSRKHDGPLVGKGKPRAGETALPKFVPQWRPRNPAHELQGTMAGK